MILTQEMIDLARKAYKKPRFWSRKKELDPLIVALQAVFNHMQMNNKHEEIGTTSEVNSEWELWKEVQKAENAKIHQAITSLALKIDRVDKKEQILIPEQSLLVYLYEKEYNYREGLARFIERLDEYLEIQLTKR